MGGPCLAPGKGELSLCKLEVEAAARIDEVKVVQIERYVSACGVDQAKAGIKMLVGDIDMHGGRRELLIGSDKPGIHVRVRDLSLKGYARKGIGWKEHGRSRTQGASLAARHAVAVDAAASRRKAVVHL